MYYKQLLLYLVTAADFELMILGLSPFLSLSLSLFVSVYFLFGATSLV